MVKKKLDTWLDRKFLKLFRRQRALDLKIFNYVQLTQLFKDSSLFLPWTVYSISPSTIVHIINEIYYNDRKNILEFGSGISTFYIAKFLKTNNVDSNFISIESDKNWYKKISLQLERLDLLHKVNLIYAPIDDVEKSLSLDSQNKWYDSKILNNGLSELSMIDLVIVDGPDGRFSNYARYSAIPFIKDQLNTSYSIFLDDANRIEEKKIAETWQKLLDCDIDIMDNYAHLSKGRKFLTNPYTLG